MYRGYLHVFPCGQFWTLIRKLLQTRYTQRFISELSISFVRQSKFRKHKRDILSQRGMF